MESRSPASFVATILHSRRSFLATIVLCGALGAGCAAGTYSTYGVGTGVAAPPPLYGPGPQELVVLPGTNVYAAPSYGSGLYFVDGWWWRPWNGRWYRTSRYGSDWRYYAGTPSFYRSIPHDWRSDYHRHQWRGRPWSYHRVPRHEAVTNWDRWKRDQRWSRDDRRGDRDGDRYRDRDRSERYRYDDGDFRREPVRYERDERSRNDEDRREYERRVQEQHYSREADHQRQRGTNDRDTRQGSTVIRRQGREVTVPGRPQRTIVVPVAEERPSPSGRGVRRGHDNRNRANDEDAVQDERDDRWRRR